MSKQFKEVDISTFLDLLTVNAIWVEAPQLPLNVSADPDDDKTHIYDQVMFMNK